MWNIFFSSKAKNGLWCRNTHFRPFFRWHRVTKLRKFKAGVRKIKQLLSNCEAERWEKLSNLRLAKKSVAYKKL
jgi:hypothetical protein